MILSDDVSTSRERVPLRGSSGTVMRGSPPRFLELLENRGFGNLLERHIKYAIKLASSEEELLYEEMHKLFSLCDEIEALRFLGLKVSPALEKELVKALRLRFKREKRKAHLVAEDRFERWKTGWWYTENLARS
jgi:hypothetical protein